MGAPSSAMACGAARDAGPAARAWLGGCAAALGADYALLGHVKPTESHPGAKPLGWEAFEALCRDRPMSIYAIGGLRRADLAEAKRRGAHGVALRSAAFGAGQ